MNNPALSIQQDLEAQQQEIADLKAQVAKLRIARQLLNTGLEDLIVDCFDDETREAMEGLLILANAQFDE